MTADTDPSLDEALTWAARMQDPAFDDWDAHAAWLTSHPDNPARYHDAVLAMETGLDAVLAAAPVPPIAPAASNDDEPHPAPRRTHRWRWATGAGMGIAACIAGLVFVSHAAHQQEIMLHGVPGQTKQFSLPDGSIVALNGASVLRFTGGERRLASLDRGEAFIRVIHDPAHPFELRAGDRTFRDVGTAFDVSLLGDTVKLAVTEGAVAFDPQGANIPITAGRAILVRGTMAVTSDVPISSVGTWRSGRLTFRDAPLADVAHDLSLALGEPVTLGDGVGSQRLSGIIALAGNPAQVVDQFSRITGLKTRKTNSGWMITAAPAATEDGRDARPVRD
jgi:transmembrane sensor